MWMMLAAAIDHGVGTIPVPRNPFKIIERCVLAVVVLVVWLTPWRTRPYEGFKNKAMHHVVVWAPISAKLQRQIAAPSRMWFKNASRLSSLSWAYPLDPSKIGNFVPPLESDNWPPGFDIHTTIVSTALA